MSSPLSDKKKKSIVSSETAREIASLVAANRNMRRATRKARQGVRFLENVAGAYIAPKEAENAYRLTNLGENIRFTLPLTNDTRGTKASTTRRRLSAANMANLKLFKELRKIIPQINEEVRTYEELLPRYNRALMKNPDEKVREKALAYSAVIRALIGSIDADVNKYKTHPDFALVKKQLESQTLPLVVKLRKEFTSLQEYFASLK